jgi:hypothetical protein
MTPSAIAGAQARRMATLYETQRGFNVNHSVPERPTDGSGNPRWQWDEDFGRGGAGPADCAHPPTETRAMTTSSSNLLMPFIRAHC